MSRLNGKIKHIEFCDPNNGWQVVDNISEIAYPRVIIDFTV